MKKITAFLVTICFISQTLHAQVYPSDTASWYIVSAIGSKYLTVKDASTEPGARLEIRTFTGEDAVHPSANQVWTLQEFGNQHHYFIKSRQGKVIDLKDGRTENGAVIHMWGFGGYTNHRWQLIDAGGGYFYIKNWTSGKVLDVHGGVNENGREVWSYQRNNSASQKWKFVKSRGQDNAELLTGEPTFCEHGYEFSGTQDIEINSGRIYYCPQKQDEWESITSQQSGISAKNRTNHYIGWSAAGKDGLILGSAVGRNWYPLADMKKVHVGTLCDIGYFNPDEELSGVEWWLKDDDERDFNLHVDPASQFKYQIEKRIAGFDPGIEFAGFYDCVDNWVKCDNTLVMEGEITPDEEFRADADNPWLGIKDLDGTSVLFKDQKIGMYGPWLKEEAHCNHPEIHPVEMLWSETVFPQVKYLCLFQDDSDRFGYYSDFPDYEEARNIFLQIPTQANKVKLEDVKRKIHPWAATPLSGQFYIAFEIDPSSNKKINYTIDVQAFREVVTNSAASKIPVREYSGKTRVIKNNGVEVFKVTELQPNENDIAIRFELFKNKERNKILGYMVISAAVSRDLDGKEGYMIIRLDKSN